MSFLLTVVFLAVEILEFVTKKPHKTWVVATQRFFVYFHPDPWGFMIQFDEHIFQMAWFNHQLP